MDSLYGARSTSGRYYSTHDKRNYIPEPEVWNERYRRTLEGRIQSSNQCFIQYPYYDENYQHYDGTKYVYKPPLYTKNNTRVPEGVLFAEVIKSCRWQTTYSIGNVYDAHWDSVLEQSPTVDEFCDEFQDPDSFLPIPAMSQFEKGIDDTNNYVSSLEPRIQDVFEHRVGTHNGLSKFLHLQSVAASHQFTRPSYSLEQAFDFSAEFAIDLNKARYWVRRTWDLASFMDRELDGFHEILSHREYGDLEKCYRDEDLGFEDIYFREIDGWRQIYRNQEERRRSTTATY